MAETSVERETADGVLERARRAIADLPVFARYVVRRFVDDQGLRELQLGDAPDLPDEVLDCIDEELWAADWPRIPEGVYVSEGDETVVIRREIDNFSEMMDDAIEGIRTSVRQLEQVDDAVFESGRTFSVDDAEDGSVVVTYEE